MDVIQPDGREAPRPADRARSPWLGYATALGSVGLALAFHVATFPHLRFAPFLLFVPCVMLAAYVGGLGPGLLATVASAAAVGYVLLDPPGLLQLADWEEILALAVFSLVAAMTAWLVASRHRAERSLATTLASIGDGVIVSDTRGSVTFMNPVAASLTGWVPEQAIGRPLGEVFRIVNEETRATVDNPALRAIATGVIHGLANHTVLLGRGGIERPVEDSAAPIISGKKVLGAVLVFRDVTERRRAERRSAHLAAIVESSSDAIYSKTLDGIITSWNAGAVRVYGYTAEEIIGRPAALLTAPDRPDEEALILERIRRGELIDHFETVRIRNDGRPIDVSLTISPIKDRQGTVVGASAIARDISERKETEKLRDALLAGEQRSRLEAERAVRAHERLERSLGLLVDASGTLLQAPNVDRVLPEVIGLASRLVAADGYAVWRYSTSDRVWHMDAASGLSEAYQQAATVALRAAAPDGFVPFDEPLVAEDVFSHGLLESNREAYRLEGIESLLAMPLRGRQAQLMFLTLYYRTPKHFEDVEIRTVVALGNLAAAAIGSAELYDEQSRLRVEAQDAEERSRFLAEASRELGSSLDYGLTLQRVAQLAVPRLADWCTVDMLEEGRIRRVAVAHADPERIRWAKAFGERYRTDPDAEQGVARVLRTGEAEYVREIPAGLIERAARDEEHRQELLRLGLLSYLCVPMVAHARTLGAITFLTTVESGRQYTEADLQMAKELAARAALAVDNSRLFHELQEANRTKDEFLATLSHELRTPLNAVLGWSRLLASGRLDEGASQKALSTIERNAEAQAQLIDDLLDVSRFVSGNLRLHVEAVDLPAVIEAAADSVRLSAEAKGVNLALALDRRVGPVAGDSGRLQQVVWNLLSNAIKFTPRDGAVSVRLGLVDSHAEIEVSDTGQGIDSRFLPYVFDRFRQADSSSTRLHGGLGLGLAIVRHLVELHGGTVAAHSEGEGRGTTFSVRLPIMVGRFDRRAQAAAAASPRPRASGELPDAPLDGLKVLVVEDDRDGREFLALVLRQAGAEVVCTESVAEALHEMGRVGFDLVLSDIGMPGEDGFSLLRRIRSLPSGSGGMPAVALTGFARPEDRERALGAGFQAHVSKPVEPTELLRTVAAIVGRGPSVQG